MSNAITNMFLVFGIVCLIRCIYTNVASNKFVVLPHEVVFLKTKDWLHYIDPDENYTYDQAEETCTRLKLIAPALFILSIRTTLPKNGGKY